LDFEADGEGVDCGRFKEIMLWIIKEGVDAPRPVVGAKDGEGSRG
jgi:hypothetical protein